jgi:anti-sigma factor RsiW
MAMKVESQLKLQAYLDGELPSGEAREVAGWLARDADARALLGELQNTVGAVAGYESELRLPEAREFYWSKIQREIRRLETTPSTVTSASWFAAWRRLLVPVASLAVVVVAAVLLAPQLGFRLGSSQAEFALTDANAFTYRDYNSGTTLVFTYRDYNSGTTLVWLPYEAENEFANTD